MRNVMTVIMLGALLMPAAAEDIHQWGRYEITLESGAAPADPLDEKLEVEFAGPGGAKHVRDGFWDGGKTWRARFAPPAVGEWTWKTRCPNDAALDGKSGAFACTAYDGGNPLYRHGAIRTTDTPHLIHADGAPFFWLADTAWNGAIRSQPADWERYLDDRVAKKFTAIQTVMTSWRTARTDLKGNLAYTGFEKIKINPAFFQQLDARLDAVNAKGLVAVPVLLWTLGKKEESPGQLPEDQAIRFARYMTARWGGHVVVWILPGDGNYGGANAERWKRIGRAVFDRPDCAPALMHPQGMQWPWDTFGAEKWLAAFTYQSGHGDDANTLRWIHSGPPAQKWRAAQPRPIINLEPPYEDHIAYQSRQRHSAYNVRRAVYWSMLNTPVAGVTYGGHGVWSWESEPATPREHGGTGVAKPWHEAMQLPGATHMKHMAELFTSLDWWRLRPVDAVAQQQPQAPVRQAPTHVVYTRDAKGQAQLYVDGARRAALEVPGDFSNWDESFRLAVGNELSGDRPWLGSIHRVALYDQALNQDDVTKQFKAGRKAPFSARPSVYYICYRWRDGEIRELMDRHENMNLRIAEMKNAEWLPDRGLKIKGAVSIATEKPATAFVKALKKTNAITIEAWLEPANATQAGPARIVTLSADTSQRNFTLGQDGANYVVRLRTTKTSDNGEPALITGGGDSAASRILASATPERDLLVAYTPLGGEVRIKNDAVANGAKAEWFDPRTGKRQPAKPTAPNTYQAPDDRDWVLLLRK